MENKYVFNQTSMQSHWSTILKRNIAAFSLVKYNFSPEYSRDALVSIYSGVENGGHIYIHQDFVVKTRFRNARNAVSTAYDGL